MNLQIFSDKQTQKLTFANMQPVMQPKVHRNLKFIICKIMKKKCIAFYCVDFHRMSKLSHGSV